MGNTFIPGSLLNRTESQQKPKQAGTFIVVEGPDGVGKSRMTQAIARALRKTEVEVVQTREPSDGSIGWTTAASSG